VGDALGALPVRTRSVMKYHFLITIELNFFFGKTFYEGWFDWGGHLLKSNGGVQR